MITVIAPLSSLRKLEQDLRQRREQIVKDLVKVNIALMILEWEEDSG